MPCPTGFRRWDCQMLNIKQLHCMHWENKKGIWKIPTMHTTQVPHVQKAAHIPHTEQWVWSFSILTVQNRYGRQGAILMKLVWGTCIKNISCVLWMNSLGKTPIYHVMPKQWLSIHVIKTSCTMERDMSSEQRLIQSKPVNHNRDPRVTTLINQTPHLH